MSACNAGDAGSIPGSGRSPGEGNGNPLQYSYLYLSGGYISLIYSVISLSPRIQPHSTGCTYAVSLRDDLWAKRRMIVSTLYTHLLWTADREANFLSFFVADEKAKCAYCYFQKVCYWYFKSSLCIFLFKFLSLEGPFLPILSKINTNTPCTHLLPFLNYLFLVYSGLLFIFYTDFLSWMLNSLF